MSKEHIKTYWMLYVRWNDGKWAPQFGDWNRATVKQEEHDSYRGEPRNRRMVVPIQHGEQWDVDRMTEVLNK